MNITKAHFANKDGTAVLVELNGSEQFAVFLDDVADPLGLAYTQWSQHNETEPFYSVPVNPLDAAEAHIAAHFTTARLLQMKDWRDTFPEEAAPMLEAVYDWLNGITIAAAQGQANFAAPPHSFEELVAEAMPFIQAA
jgi:hypothetical protein